MCKPYGYEAMQNSSLYAAQCGGADKWAGVSSTNGIFCPTSHFCPPFVRSRNWTVRMLLSYSLREWKPSKAKSVRHWRFDPGGKSDGNCQVVENCATGNYRVSCCKK